MRELTRHHPPPPSATATDATPCVNQKHVLIVDDEMNVLDIICDVLQGEGYKTTTAQTREEALIILSNSRPNVILLDIGLGKDNGLRFLPEFQAIHPQVPVVVLTGLGYDNDLIREALKQGAAAYFSKDTGIENILPLLNRLLSQST
jgi:DNA-binding NtrC family response regulator